MALIGGLARRLHLPTTLLKFLIVGGIGFLINLVMLFLLYDSPLFWFLPAKHSHVDLGLVTVKDSRLLIASVLAVEAAIIVQFNLHERWTFRRRNREGNILARFFKFNAGSIVSPLIIVVTTNVLTPVLPLSGLSPYAANGIGVLIGFSYNWFMTNLLIWPHHKRGAAEPETTIAYPLTSEGGQDFPTS